MFKMILMDINMPGMNGIDTSQKITELCLEKNIALPLIIGQSGDTDENLIDTCKKAGIVRNIAKPFSLSFFKGLLREYGII